MSRITVAASGEHLVRDGAPWVPLADTAWNALAQAEPREWRRYLRHRRTQGFTSVLVSALPTVQDRSLNPGGREPYALLGSRGGQGDARFAGYDFDAPDESYWATARRLAEIAAEEHVHLFAVALWSTYVDGTPANGLVRGASMPHAARAALADRLILDLAEFDPVIVVSGDDPFDVPEAERVHGGLLHRFAAGAPHALRTMHLWPDGRLPESIERSPELDLVLLQSGHTHDLGAKAIELGEHQAARQAELGIRRPVINIEPCYEGHGHVRGSGGRFDRDDVRRVLWTSVLAGMSAGLAYGAHGIWQWHRAGSEFLAAAATGDAFPWDVALGFPGAVDAAFARRVVDAAALYALSPAQHLLDRDDDGARVAADPATGRLTLYLPTPRAVRLGVPLGGRVEAWDLATRAPLRLRLHPDGDGTRIEQPDTLGDVLLVAG